MNAFSKEAYIDAVNKPSILRCIRESLTDRKGLYVAGEVSKLDENQLWDFHDFFVSPLELMIDPHKLNGFADTLLPNFELSRDISDIKTLHKHVIKRKAKLHDSGDLQMPDISFDQIIGQQNTILIRKRKIDASALTIDELTPREIQKETLPIRQRVTIKIFPEANLAALLYELGRAHKTIDRSTSFNLTWIYSTHVLEAQDVENLTAMYRDKTGRPVLA